MTTNSEPPGRRSRIVPALLVVAAAVLLAIAATTYFALNRNSGGEADRTATPSASATAEFTTTSALPTIPGTTFAYQPLWPFANATDAAAWQQSYRDGGHQPWHLDPGAVALNFTRGYLGYDNIDQVVLTSTRGEEAWVTVGFKNPNGVDTPAAELHLTRLGTGEDAPWEVVGTQDRTLTLATPQYATRVSSPVAVGGHITGVDESLRVQVRQLDRSEPVGEIPGIPAGGQNSPWSATVPFTATCPGTLTIAVSTGGHIEAVERFAITGVHC